MSFLVVTLFNEKVKNNSSSLVTICSTSKATAEIQKVGVHILCKRSQQGQL